MNEIEKESIRFKILNGIKEIFHFNYLKRQVVSRSQCKFVQNVI